MLTKTTEAIPAPQKWCGEQPVSRGALRKNGKKSFE